MRKITGCIIGAAALLSFAAPAQAVVIIECGGGSACLSGTTNVNLVTADDTALGMGTVGTGAGAPQVTFTTTETGGLDLDASGQATISAGDEGTLEDLTFQILTGFQAAEFNLNPLNAPGGQIQFSVAIMTSAGGPAQNFTTGNQRFAIVAGAGETLTSVTISTPNTAGFGSLTQLRVGLGQVTAVPEPATWAMMLLGFGGMGMALRRRRKSMDISQFA